MWAASFLEKLVQAQLLFDDTARNAVTAPSLEIDSADRDLK